MVCKEKIVCCNEIISFFLGCYKGNCGFFFLIVKLK